MHNSMTLETEKLILETMELPALDATMKCDYGALRELGYVADSGWPWQIFAEAVPYFIDLVVQNGGNNGFGPWICIEKNSRRVVGSVGFFGNPDERGHVEAGFGTMPAEQRKGYCFEAMTALISWAFSQPQVMDVGAECRNANTAGTKLLIKLGFEKETDSGTFTQWVRRPQLSILSRFI
jgi:RimJ/RimL family protein N-acetyltransferase